MTATRAGFPDKVAIVGVGNRPFTQLAGLGGRGEFICSAVLPVNAHGCVLFEGYPHGMETVAEAVRQIQGPGTGAVSPPPRRCVLTSGTVMDDSALILGSC